MYVDFFIFILNFIKIFFIFNIIFSSIKDGIRKDFCCININKINNFFKVIKDSNITKKEKNLDYPH
jgi:hypothetical protein